MTQRRSKQQWLELLGQQQSSCLSAAEFCRQNNISPKRFYYHASKAQQTNPLRAKPTVFLNAKVARHKPSEPSGQAICIKHGTSELLLPIAISPRWLAELITALA